MRSVLLNGMLEYPIWLQFWILWMVVINSLSIIFLGRTEGRVVLAAWIANGIFMTALAEAVGFVRLLGISHVIFWTPLVIYLLRRRPMINFQETYGRWIAVLTVTNCISLVVDYIDVVRYMMGETS